MLFYAAMGFILQVLVLSTPQFLLRLNEVVFFGLTAEFLDCYTTII